MQGIFYRTFQRMSSFQGAERVPAIRRIFFATKSTLHPVAVNINLSPGAWQTGCHRLTAASPNGARGPGLQMNKCATLRFSEVGGSIQAPCVSTYRCSWTVSKPAFLQTIIIALPRSFHAEEVSPQYERAGGKCKLIRRSRHPVDPRDDRVKA